MIFTEQFERWWRESGQFLEPIGDYKSPEMIAFAKTIAAGIHEGGIHEGSVPKSEIQDAIRDYEGKHGNASALVSELRSLC